MKVILDFFDSTAAMDMIVALLHTLWQGVAIAMVLFFVLRGVSGKRSELRYRLSILSMLLIVVCWLGTFSILQYEPEPPTSAAQNDIAYKENPVENAVTANTTETIQQEHMGVAQPKALTISTEAHDYGAVKGSRFSYARWAIMFWLAGVCVMLSRMFWALAGAAKLGREAVEIEDPAIVQLFEQLCRKMQIKRRIRFAASKTLLHPGVIGFWRPVLLVPVSILSEISVDDLRAILAHELAHIRRFDYLVNFCQMVVEAVLFFNPAVWWVSRQIRIEREACCDTAGVAVSGQRVQYARVLFEQFAKAAAPQPAMTAAITGFSDGNEAASEERVKRVIDPQHKPHIKIGWVKLACCVGIAAIVLLGLWKTTDMTIAMAAKIMTPAERIEVMAELEKSHGQPEYDPEGAGEVSDEDKATVSGIIKTWDGKKVTRRAHMAIHYSRHQSSGNIGISPTFNPETNCAWDGDTGIFSHRNSYGIIYVSVSAPGYAPACVGPYQLEPGQVKDDIEIVLERGYPALIQIVDADTQQPVPNVELLGGYLFRPGGFSYTINLKTDENGLAVIEDAGDFNVTLKGRAAGYQQTNFVDQTLLKNGTLVLEMKKAEVAEGMVLSKTTGQPISDAVIRIQQEMGKNQMSWGRDQAEILATTNDTGHFTIDQLDDETTYVLSVKADGYAYAFTDEITAGQKDILIQLQDPIVISGRVIGPLEILPTVDGKPYVPYHCTFTWNNNSHGESNRPKAFVTAQGDEGIFELTDLWGTSVRVGLEHWRKTVKLNEPLTDEIVLDLNDPLTEDGMSYHKRKLILDFDTPEGYPPPTGNIRLNYIDPAYAKNAYKGRLVEIIDGKAEAEIVAPGKIGYRVADTIGYWFKESSEIKVDDETEPLVIKVPVVPAGMIFGQVYEEDGSPAENTMVSYNMPEKSHLLDDKTSFLGIDGKNSSSDGEIETKYSISPLPLEGVYRAIAHRGDTYVVSNRIKLTEENPIQEVNLTLPKGVTVSGQILLPDGTPASDIEYKLDFDVTDGHGFSRSGQYTGADGRFIFEQVNPDADGTYLFQVKCSKNYRPVQMKLEKFDKPIEIQLEQGAVATGQVVDKDTGWPIPNVEVSAWYHNYNQDNSEYEQIQAEAKTDTDGRFRFSNMKPGREYHINFSGCRQDDPGIIGGQTKDKVYEVTLSKWSQLKPRKPDDVE